MHRYGFTVILKSQGCGDSATQPQTVQVLTCRQLRSLSFLQDTWFHLFPRNQYCGSWSPSATRCLQNTGLSTPLLHNLSRWAPLATLCKSHNMVQFYTSNAILTPNIKSQELWSMETNGTGKRCQDFDKCLPSVLSQFKAIIKFNLKKTK